MTDMVDEDALQLWLKYKREKKHTYTPMGLTALRKKLAAMGDNQMASVEHCMACNYTGLWAVKQEKPLRRARVEDIQ